MALAITGFVASAQAATVTYGWEDVPAAEVLGTNNPLPPASAFLATFPEDDTNHVRSGQYSLGLTDTSGSGTTPQAFVGWVTGLQNGDQVTASFWVYDTSSGSPSGRIWGHYTSDVNNIYSLTTSTSANNQTYSASTGWSQLAYTWTFNSNSGKNTGLVIEARSYDTADGRDNTIYIDDLSITAPNHAKIITPSAVPVPGSALLLGAALAGLGALRCRLV